MEAGITGCGASRHGFPVVVRPCVCGQKLVFTMVATVRAQQQHSSSSIGNERWQQQCARLLARSGEWQRPRLPYMVGPPKQPSAAMPSVSPPRRSIGRYGQSTEGSRSASGPAPDPGRGVPASQTNSSSRAVRTAFRHRCAASPASLRKPRRVAWSHTVAQSSGGWSGTPRCTLSGTQPLAWQGSVSGGTGSSAEVRIARA